MAPVRMFDLAEFLGHQVLFGISLKYRCRVILQGTYHVQINLVLQTFCTSSCKRFARRDGFALDIFPTYSIPLGENETLIVASQSIHRLNRWTDAIAPILEMRGIPISGELWRKHSRTRKDSGVLMLQNAVAFLLY